MNDIDSYGLVFGITPNLPTIPDGWSYGQNAEDFLILYEYGTGNRYYAGIIEGKVIGYRKKKAGIFDFIRTMGRLTIGQYFLDIREPIVRL